MKIKRKMKIKLEEWCERCSDNRADYIVIGGNEVFLSEDDQVYFFCEDCKNIEEKENGDTEDA